MSVAICTSAVQKVSCLSVAVDSFEVQEVALHTGEWKETIYSVSADVLDGVRVYWGFFLFVFLMWLVAWLNFFSF